MKNVSRQRMLLVIAAALAIMLSAGLGVVSRIRDAITTLDTEVTELKAEYERRKKIDDSRRDYQNQTEIFDEAYAVLTEKYPATITQNNQLLFLRDIEDEFGVRIASASYTNPEILYRFKYTAAGNSEAYRLVRSTIQFPMELSYNEFKRFIDYIEETDGREVIETVIADYDESGETVSADVTISQYAILGDDRTGEDATTEVETGTDNIFISEGVTLSTGADTAEEAAGYSGYNSGYSDGYGGSYSYDTGYSLNYDYNEPDHSGADGSSYYTDDTGTYPPETDIYSGQNYGDSTGGGNDTDSSSGIRSNLR